MIDLPPEFIIPQDGHDKQDSEIAAAKRWLEHHAKRYQPYGVTILGDDLFSHQPFCEAILKKSYILFLHVNQNPIKHYMSM